MLVSLKLKSSNTKVVILLKVSCVLVKRSNLLQHLGSLSGPLLKDLPVM